MYLYLGSIAWRLSKEKDCKKELHEGLWVYVPVIEGLSKHSFRTVFAVFITDITPRLLRGKRYFTTSTS